MNLLRSNPRILFTLTLLLAAIVLVLQALPWVPRARLLPLTFGIPLVVLLLSQLISELRAARDPSGARAEDRVMDVSVDADVSDADVIQRGRNAFLWLLGLVLGAKLFGLLVAVPAFTVGYLGFVARPKPVLFVTLTVLVLAILFGVFHTVVHLPWGSPVFPQAQRAIIDLLP